MLTASHLTRRFGDRVAVDDASFALEPGEIFALLGPNGAGKTTTLRMLAGLIAPTAGEVTRGGRIGFLTEAPGLWDRLTVRQNLTVYAKLHGLPKPSHAVDEVLELFGVRGRAADFTAQLSKGLKQRVALARTLLHKPDVVLLDEPTSGLDPESARDVRELIVRMREEGRAVLLSTHNLGEVERIADRVGVLNTRMLAVDTPRALRMQLFGSRLRVRVSRLADAFLTAVEGPGISDVRVDDRTVSMAVDSDGRAPAIVRRLVAAGADIEEVVTEQPSLEDVYLRLVKAEVRA